MLEVGQKVQHRDWLGRGVQDVGTVESVRRVSADVRWDAYPNPLTQPFNRLVSYAPEGTESPEAIGEEEMERKFEVDQAVHDAGGMIGHITSYEERDNGVFYKVLGENSAETLNIQSVLHPVRELKSTPTPKEVRQVVETKAPQYEAESVIEAWDLNFSLGNVVWSVYNASQDSSLELQELERAAYYLNRRINKLEAK